MKGMGNRTKKDSKEREDETTHDYLSLYENLDPNPDDGNDFQEPSAIKDDRNKAQVALRTSFTQRWRDIKLRTVIIAALHFFQVCGMVYLLHQNTTTHEIQPCHQSNSFKTVLKEASVCRSEGTDESEKYKNVADNLHLLLDEFHIDVNFGRHDKEAWVNGLSNYSKTLENVIENITFIEKNMRKMLQNINLLQNNFTNKTEEENEPLKQVVENYMGKMLEVEQNMSRLFEDAQKYNTDLQNKRRLSEEKIQTTLKDLQELYDNIECKMGTYRMKFAEEKKKIFDVVEQIKANIIKLEGDVNEFYRTFLYRQFRFGKQSILIDIMITIIDEKVMKVKQDLGNEKRKLKSTNAYIKGLEGNIKGLHRNIKEKERHLPDEFRSTEQSVNEMVKMVKGVDKLIEEDAKRIDGKFDALMRKLESTMAYIEELGGNMKTAHLLAKAVEDYATFGSKSMLGKSYTFLWYYCLTLLDLM